MPTNLQALASVCVCQSLSDMLQPIHLFRYDPNQKQIFILAGVNEGIEITIFENGNGSFTPMTKPNFTTMNRKELKAYIRTHPTDSDAIRELFVNRRRPDAKTYPFPYDMSKQELEEIFRKKQEQE